MVASAPAGPADPPEGASLRLRRVRVGEDVGGRVFRAARRAGSACRPTRLGRYFAPVEGGRLQGPLRVTEAFAVVDAARRSSGSDAGALRVPFSLTRQIDQAELRMPERAAIASTLAPDFRVGAGIGGDFGALSCVGGGDVVQPHARRRRVRPRRDGRRARGGGADRPGRRLTPWRRPPAIPGPTGSGSGTASRSCTARCTKQRRSAPAWTCRCSGGASRRPPSTSSCTRRRGTSRAPSSNPASRWARAGSTSSLRGEWQRAAGANGWGAGAAMTIYARDPRARLQAGFERRTGPDAARPPPATRSLRLTFAID